MTNKLNNNFKKEDSIKHNKKYFDNTNCENDDSFESVHQNYHKLGTTGKMDRLILSWKKK